MSSNQWCILRCAGQNTLPLLRSLEKAGFEVWSPVEKVCLRLPRANVKRWIDSPMLKSYVFARADRLIDLIAASKAPGGQHRDFSVFKHKDRFPLIDEETLAPLRSIERKRKPRGTVRSIPVGAKVRLNDGGFAGLDGVVESVSNKHAMVQFAGFPIAVKIGCWLIAEGLDGNDNVQVECQSPERHEAA